MTTSDVPPRQQIIAGLNEKAKIKSTVYDQTLDVFNSLKEVLHEMSNDINELLEEEDNRRLRFEYRDRGKYEAELKFADDVLLFSMHSDTFQFDRDHPVLKTAYVKNDPYASYCGMISIYNFLTDSFKYGRKDDLGYLVARLFINKDRCFLVEGKRQKGRKLNIFGDKALDKADLVAMVETAVLYTLSFDLLVPPYEMVAQVSVEQMNAKIDTAKLPTGKRMGFRFCADDVKAD